MDRLLSACSKLTPHWGQAPIPRMAALSLTVSSSEKHKVRRKHLCEQEERCGDEQLGSGLHHEAHSKQGLISQDSDPVLPVCLLTVYKEIGNFMFNPAAFLKQMFLSASRITEKKGIDRRRGN